MPELAELLAFIEEGEGAATAEAATTEAAGGAGLNVITPPAAVEKDEKDPVSKALPKFDFNDIPIPSGGISLLLLIIMTVVLAFMPAPGQDCSRLVLIWRAFIGRAVLDTHGGGDPTSSGSATSGAVTGALPKLPGAMSGALGHYIEGGIY